MQRLPHNIKQVAARFVEGLLAVVQGYSLGFDGHPLCRLVEGIRQDPNVKAVKQLLDHQRLSMARRHPLELDQGLWHGREWVRGHVAGIVQSKAVCVDTVE